MSVIINSVTGTAAGTASSISKKQAAAENIAAESNETTAKTQQDIYVKSNGYIPDADKIRSMKAELSGNTEAFRKMVAAMMSEQGEQFLRPYAAKLNIDLATQEEAMAAIAEDGYWGAEQTAGRILDFAKALTGGDPAKVSEMRSAFERGFKEAERIWGGKLPEISRKTYEKVMAGFDEWEGLNTEE